MEKKIKDLKRGEYFTLRPIDEPNEYQVYVRGDYDRGCRRYDCHKFSDINTSRLFRGDMLVYVEFTF